MHLKKSFNLYRSDLSEQSEFLYNEMLSKTKAKLEEMGDFNDFLNNIFVSKIKASSGQKADIIMEIIDIQDSDRLRAFR